MRDEPRGPNPAVRVYFHYPAAPGETDEEYGTPVATHRLYVNGPQMDGTWETAHPPQVGDEIVLHDQQKRTTHILWRVVRRQWMPASFLSVNWPVLEPHQKTPLWLNVLLEPVEDGGIL